MPRYFQNIFPAAQMSKHGGNVQKGIRGPQPYIIAVKGMAVPLALQNLEAQSGKNNRKTCLTHYNFNPKQQ